MIVKSSREVIRRVTCPQLDCTTLFHSFISSFKILNSPSTIKMTSSRCTSPDRINWEDWIHLSDLYSSARDTILDRSIEDTYSPSPHIISIGESSNVTEGSFQIVKSNSNHIINDPQPNLEASSVPSPKIHQSFLIQSTGKKAVINSTEEKQMPVCPNHH